MGHTRVARLFVLGLREWCPVPKVSVFGMCSWWSVRSIKYQLRKTNLALCEEFNRTMLVGKKIWSRERLGRFSKTLVGD